MAEPGMWDRIKGEWKNVVGHAEKQWGKLTHDELMQSRGEREILAGHIQSKYGITKEEAHRQMDEFAKKMEQSQYK